MYCLDAPNLVHLERDVSEYTKDTEITVTMPEWLKAAIDRKAEAERITDVSLIRKALLLYVMGKLEESPDAV